MQSFPARHTFRILALLSAFTFPALHSHIFQAGGAPAEKPQAATSLFVDVHAHLDPADPEHAIQAALLAMQEENATKIIFMPPPFTEDDPMRYDAELILPQVKGHGDKLLVLGGGGSLNAMIQESVRSGDAGSEVRKRFKQEAEALLHEGVAGFGEMTAEHFEGATAYQYAPPDHPLFLLLADIAAEHGVPIDLHMEAVPRTIPLPAGFGSPPNPPQLHANLAAFERLLAHNKHARIIWAHAGWDNTAYRTADLCRRLLAAHPNLYMELKIDPVNPGKNSPLSDETSGPIEPEWLQLFQDFPDRFLIGSDQHYPAPQGPQRWQAVVLLFNQLPPELQKKIGVQNAEQLYAVRPKR